MISNQPFHLDVVVESVEEREYTKEGRVYEQLKENYRVAKKKERKHQRSSSSSLDFTDTSRDSTLNLDEDAQSGIGSADLAPSPPQPEPLSFEQSVEQTLQELQAQATQAAPAPVSNGVLSSQAILGDSDPITLTWATQSMHDFKNGKVMARENVLQLIRRGIVHFKGQGNVVDIPVYPGSTLVYISLSFFILLLYRVYKITLKPVLAQ